MIKTCFKKESCEKYGSTLPNLIDHLALPILPHLTTLPSTALKQKYLVASVICMNNDTNKSVICHHKLAKWELVNILIMAIGGELNNMRERKKTKESEHTI